MRELNVQKQSKNWWRKHIQPKTKKKGKRKLLVRLNDGQQWWQSGGPLVAQSWRNYSTCDGNDVARRARDERRRIGTLLVQEEEQCILKFGIFNLDFCLSYFKLRHKGQFYLGFEENRGIKSNFYHSVLVLRPPEAIYLE